MARFLDGMGELAEKIHAINLSIGIESSKRLYLMSPLTPRQILTFAIAAGRLTCAGYPVSLGYEDIDAADFAN